jgi:hypothetical protein
MTTLVGHLPVARAAAGVGSRHWLWIYSRRTDLLLAFCWVPVFAVAHQLSAGHGVADDRLLRSLVTWTLLVSLLHQPLTLLLVYGDRHQLRPGVRCLHGARPLRLPSSR